MSLQPIDLVELVAITLGCMMFLIPIAGLTLRFAIKPLVDALTQHWRANDRARLELLERRLHLLEAELPAHASTLDRATALRLPEDL